MEEFTVRIQPNGDLMFVHKDGHPAMNLGRADIQRASDVRFNKTKQKWEIFLQRGGDEIKIGGDHTLRDHAIKEEVHILNKILMAAEQD